MELQIRKVVIIGAGHVGSHAGYALISQGLAEEIIYIDTDEKKSRAQVLDLSDASVYLRKHAIVRVGSYADAKDADLLIVAAGPLPDMSKGQTRMDTLKQTVKIMKNVTKNIRMSDFRGIILNISNPADVITHYIQHALDWPEKRIFSTSTVLDTARLRRAISEKINVDPKSVCAYVLGEHGESQMVPWSTVTVAGKPLSQLCRERPETYGKLNLTALADAGKSEGWSILGGKGSTEFEIGASIAEVVRAIFGNENRVLPVSVLLNGPYGQHDVYDSVPSLINRNGISDIIELKLTDEELRQFDESCRTMSENYRLALTF